MNNQELYGLIKNQELYGRIKKLRDMRVTQGLIIYDRLASLDTLLDKALGASENNDAKGFIKQCIENVSFIKGYLDENS